MPEFYATVVERRVWNVTVEADNRGHAKVQAIDEAVGEPDETDFEVIYVQEVTKHNPEDF